MCNQDKKWQFFISIFFIFKCILTLFKIDNCCFYVTAPASQSHKTEPENSFITSSPFGSLSKRKKQRIFDIIITEIGSFWRDLARNLKIRERDIDDIDFQNKTLDAKASKLMEKYEAIADPQRWFFLLSDALERTRRKDLVRSIQDIMAMNI